VTGNKIFLIHLFFRQFTTVLVLLAPLLLFKNQNLYCQESFKLVEKNCDKRYFINLTKKEGLPAEVVYEVVQDRQGFTWIGTDDGLARYDGQSFRVFRYNPEDNNSLADNSVTALTLSNDSSRLWIGTFQGLSVIDLHTGRIYTYAHDMKGKKNFPVKNAKCFLPENNGAMWIGSDYGLIYVPALERPFKFFNTQLSNDLNDFKYFTGNIIAMKFYPSDSTRIILATAGGVAIFDRLKEKIVKLFDLQYNNSHNYSALFLDENNILYACGWSTGLCRIELNTGKWKQYTFENDLPFSFVSIIKPDKDHLWLASPAKGIGVFDLKSESICYISHEQNDNRSIISNNLQRLNLMKKNNLVWVSTTSGLSFEDIRYISFDMVSPPYQYYWISDYNYDDKTRKLYIGSYYCQGLFVLNKTDNLWNIINYDKSLNIPFLDINTLYRDSKGTLWIGSRNNLLYYDEPANLLKLFKTPEGNPIDLQTPVIYAIREDLSGNLWIGTSREGAVKIDDKRQKVTYYRHRKNDVNSIAGGMTIRAIETDNFGRVWIANYIGLSIYQPEKDNFFVVAADTFLNQKIRYNYIYSMEKDTLGRMWLSMDRLGLVRAEADRNFVFSFKLFQTSQGLDDLIIKYITKDPNGELWICNNSLVHFNPYNETTNAFDMENGIHSRLIGDSKIYVDAENNIYLGSTGGYETMNIDRLVPTSGISNLLLDGLEVNGKPFSSAYSLQGNNVIKLSADQRNLTFHYSAICYYSSEKVKFSYRLLGYENNWIFASNNREARYTNLSPGAYEFQVKTSCRGIYYPKHATLKVIIPPFFWQTWWFILIASGIIAFSVYFLYKSFIENRPSFKHNKY
jgi:ligand-binding sensor domain-containing protein